MYFLFAKEIKKSDTLLRNIIDNYLEDHHEDIRSMAAKKRGQLGKMFGGEGDSTDGEDSDDDY